MPILIGALGLLSSRRVVELGLEACQLCFGGVGTTLLGLRPLRLGVGPLRLGLCVTAYHLGPLGCGGHQVAVSVVKAKIDILLSLVIAMPGPQPEPKLLAPQPTLRVGL